VCVSERQPGSAASRQRARPVCMRARHGRTASLGDNSTVQVVCSCSSKAGVLHKSRPGRERYTQQAMSQPTRLGQRLLHMPYCRIRYTTRCIRSGIERWRCNQLPTRLGQRLLHVLAIPRKQAVAAQLALRIRNMIEWCESAPSRNAALQAGQAEHDWLGRHTQVSRQQTPSSPGPRCSGSRRCAVHFLLG